MVNRMSCTVNFDADERHDVPKSVSQPFNFDVYYPSAFEIVLHD